MASLDLHEQPVAIVLAHYNELRIAKGQEPLAKWKDSKTKLLDAIARIDPVIETKPAEKPVKRAVVKTDTIQRSPKDPSVFTLADLARDIGVDPKVLRAKARRHQSDLDKLMTTNGSHSLWTFPASNRDAVAKILNVKLPSKKAAA